MDGKILLVLVLLVHSGNVCCRRLKRAPEVATNEILETSSKTNSMSDNEIDEDLPTTELPYITSTDVTPEETTDRGQVQKPDGETPAPESEQTHHGKKKYKLDPIDEFLLQGLLDIVDEKFSSIGKRMMTLERAMNNLQYYNVRSFRVVNTHLHALDTILHGMHSEINQVDLQNRALEQGIGIVKRDVADLNSMNSEMFEAIEQNLVHFHKDMRSRMSDVKADIYVNKGVLSKLENDTTDIKMALKDLSRSSTDIIQNTELLMLSTTQVIKSNEELANETAVVMKTTTDLVMNTEGIIHSTANIAKVMKSLNRKTDDLKVTFTEALFNISSPSMSSSRKPSTSTEKEGLYHSGDDGDENLSQFQEFKSPKSKMGTTCGKVMDYLEERFESLERTINTTNQNNTSTAWPDIADFNNSSQTLIRALATVNENVLQSLTFYRHTGDLIERVLADTEMVASEQMKLRMDLQDFIGNSSLYFEGRNFSSLDVMNGSEDCIVPQTLFTEINSLTKNNTQLVELLTDLASISSTSMKSSLTELNREITRMNQAVPERDRNNLSGKTEALTREPSSDLNMNPILSSHIKDTHNRTEWIYQIVEAIASNTGWIPYIFHNMRFVENQVNKTLKISNDIFQRSEEILKRQRATTPAPPPPQGTTPSVPIADNSKLKQQLVKTQTAVTKPTINTLQDAERIHPTKENYDVTVSNMSAMMEFVYGTNVKLDRLLPALTSLLGEPEPYISLVNGKTDREGRVEIYHKGRWGTVCDSNLGHLEASYVCRSLGYLGGISGGSGYFGPGGDDVVFWTLNVTCLRTRWCNAVLPVNEPEYCNHDNDFAVICDHMIRLMSPDDDDTSRERGMVEMFHDSRWSPVCSRGWGYNETQVTCRQLGFQEGSFTEVKDDTLVDTHWLTDVTCKGNEDRLDACVLGGFEYNGCPDFKHISVVCT